MQERAGTRVSASERTGTGREREGFSKRENEGGKGERALDRASPHAKWRVLSTCCTMIVLQHCNTLPHAAKRCNTLQQRDGKPLIEPQHAQSGGCHRRAV